MNKIFAIFPIDKSSSTKFLNRIHTFESRMVGDHWHCYKVHFSDADHERCLQQLKNSHFIFFMGHGSESHLHGACAKNGEMTVDFMAAQENEEFYEKKIFVDESNIEIFQSKVLFCLSCNSNRNSKKSLARMALKSGVTTFVGFGDIPTDYVEENHLSKRCIAIFKGKIVKIIKYALYYAIDNNDTIDNLVRYVKMLTCKEILFLRAQSYFHGRNEVIEQLYKFKNDIKVYGDAYVKLLTDE